MREPKSLEELERDISRLKTVLRQERAAKQANDVAISRLLGVIMTLEQDNADFEKELSDEKQVPCWRCDHKLQRIKNIEEKLSEAAHENSALREKVRRLQSQLPNRKGFGKNLSQVLERYS